MRYTSAGNRKKRDLQTKYRYVIIVHKLLSLQQSLANVDGLSFASGTTFLKWLGDCIPR